jgi:hypothetical protein
MALQTAAALLRKPLRYLRNRDLEATWRSGDAADCKSADCPIISRPLPKTINFGTIENQWVTLISEWIGSSTSHSSRNKVLSGCTSGNALRNVPSDEGQCESAPRIALSSYSGFKSLARQAASRATPINTQNADLVFGS